MLKADHTCIAVSDLKSSEEFYARALRYVTVEKRRINEKVSMVFMRSECGGYKLQLIAGRGAPAPEYGHTAVTSNDFDADLAKHQSLGVTCSGLIFCCGQRSYFIRDPDGYETEVVECAVDQKAKGE